MSDWESADGWESAEGWESPSSVSEGNVFTGVGEAALSLGTSLAITPIAGLRGLGTLLTGGDLDTAVKKIQGAQEEAYQPRTKTGQVYTENAAKVLNLPAEYGGKLGEAIAGNEGRLVGEIAGEFATDFIPFGLAAKAAKRRGVKTSPSIDKAIAEEALPPVIEPVQMELPLEVSSQQIAEMQGRAAGQPDLFGPVNEPVGKTIPQVTPFERPGPLQTTSQHVLFDQPELGRMANPYEARLGDWRVDENGIPVKVDLSMELQNLQNPLQRNLWGDELEPTRPPVGQGLQGVETGIPQGGIPLTQAIDSMPDLPWRSARDEGIDLLRGDITPSGELLSSVSEANRRIPSSQRGAIDLSLFDDVFEKIKRLPDGRQLRAWSDGVELHVTATDKDGNFLGRTSMSPENWANPKKTDNLVANWTDVAPVARKQGLAEQMYKFLAELGNDISPSKSQSTDGKKMWEGFEKRGVSTGMRIPRSQRGALDFGPQKPLPPEQRPQKKDTVQTPRSPEKIAEKQEIKAKLKALDIRDQRVKEYDTVNTKEEAVSLAPDTKDIPKDYGQKRLAPGLNFMAAFHDNPVLRFAQTILRNAHTAADAFSRKYITADKTGLSPVWNKMKPEDRIKVMEALQSADKHQKDLTPELMAKLGFNETQVQFVNTFREATDAMYTRGNDVLMQLGFEPFQYRKGYFPGVFSGAYKTLVTDAKGNVTGVISVDTIYQQRAAKKYVEQATPGVKFIDQKRRGLEGSHISSDMFSGMSDVFKLLGDNDPRFAEVQAVVSEAIRAANHQLYNFNVHELNKKGVFGNKGNEPWISPEKNATEAFKALVKYFEDGALYFELQQPLKDLKDLASDPAVAHLPNTVEYMQQYVNNIEGKNVSDLGKALNLIIDLPAKLIGIGPGTAMKLTGAVKNRMSHVFMGFGNWAFTASQLVQPFQTGVPFLSLVSSKLGDVSVASAMGRGSIDFMLMTAENITGQKMDLVQPHMREAFDYARERGLLDFSEMEKAYEGTKSKVGQVVDTIAEANMKIGEQATRTPMFMTFVDLLVQGGIPVKKALPIAENLTQLSMIDYHKWERPMVYSNLGVLGQFAGGLTTFKHGYLGQQGLLAKQAIKPTDGKRQIKPIAYSMMAMIALAGITGAPFYQELDEVFGYLSNKFGGERKSIRETVLSGLPEWVKTGAISTATGVNAQGKFSSADMIPDSLAQAASPHLSAAGDIISQAIDVAKYGDDQSLRNLLIASTPSGWKGWAEYEFARNDLGQVIGKDGMPLVNRSEEDWKKRKYSGLRPQEEAVAREELFQARKKEKADQEAKAQIANDVKRAVINNTLTQEKLNEYVEKYRLRKGDPQELVEVIEKASLNKNFTEKQRAEGIPKDSLSSVYRYQYYNK